MKLTPEQIENEPAGIQIDAWVAEHVMKIEPIVWDENTEDYYCPYCKDRMRFCGERSWCSTCSEWRYSPYKEYSSDIISAWEIIEKIHKDGWGIELSDTRLDPDVENRGWWYELNRYDDPTAVMEGKQFATHYYKLDGSAETIELAICRAALITTIVDDM